MDSLATTPRGEPPKAFDVRATYDSRPVQGFDYNIPDSVAASIVDETTLTVELSFIVPRGYVAVQKRFRHWFNPVPAIASREQCRVSFLISGAGVPYNELIPIGVESDVLSDGFFIADELQTVTARVIVSNLGFTLSTTLYCVFYGNLILKTGVPSPFEVANPTDKIWLPTGYPQPANAPRTERVIEKKTAPVVMQTLVSAPQPTLQAPTTAQPPKRGPFHSGRGR